MITVNFDDNLDYEKYTDREQTTNLTMMTDLYQLKMMQAHFYNNTNLKDRYYFEYFFRNTPDGNGYCISVGLEQVLQYIQNIKFTNEDIAYLSRQGFRKEFLDYLAKFKFTGTLRAVKEGTIVFPNEPIITVEAPILEAQFIETTLLNIMNHQTLIATKASRVSQAIHDTNNLGSSYGVDMGLRRAHGPDAGIYGARATYIGGMKATSNVLAGKIFNIPIMGTHAHSWVMSFDTELEAFNAFADNYDDGIILLVDTYDTLRSGIPNAIKVFQRLQREGRLPHTYGIRLDSGDLAYLSQEARKMLDEAGFNNAQIVASNDLDENIITNLRYQGAKIDVYGVGTSLITSKSCPALGGVYKLTSIIKEDGTELPKMKFSENIVKISNPYKKNLYRLIDKKTGMYIADYLAPINERLATLTLHKGESSWNKRVIFNDEYEAIQLLETIIEDGVVLKSNETLDSIKNRAFSQLERLWPEYKRLLNPEIYSVNISDTIYDKKVELLHKYKG